jgi:hypothetical protein
VEGDLSDDELLMRQSALYEGLVEQVEAQLEEALERLSGPQTAPEAPQQPNPVQMPQKTYNAPQTAPQAATHPVQQSFGQLMEAPAASARQPGQWWVQAFDNWAVSPHVTKAGKQTEKVELYLGGNKVNTIYRGNPIYPQLTFLHIMPTGQSLYMAMAVSGDMYGKFFDVKEICWANTYEDAVAAFKTIQEGGNADAYSNF